MLEASEKLLGRIETYVRADAEAFSKGKPFTQEERENTYRQWLADGTCFHPYFSPLSREGTVFTFEVRVELIL